MSELTEEFHLARVGVVASTTGRNDRYLLGRISPQFCRLPVNGVSGPDVQAEMARQATDWSKGSLERFRDVMSALFAYSVARRLRYDNPVQGVKVPDGAPGHEKTEIYPFTLDELRIVVDELVEVHRDGDLALFLGLTGLRFGEVIALRVKDVLELPHRAVRVSRSGPTGHPIRDSTKGGCDRFVPLVDEAWPVLFRRLDGKGLNDLVFTNTKGRRLRGWTWKLLVHWAEHSHGLRVQDLRHTAATLWLASGVPPKTVQAWLGHASATMTLDVYAHYMPNSEALHGLAIMNDRLSGGGSSGARGSGRQGSATSRDVP